MVRAAVEIGVVMPQMMIALRRLWDIRSRNPGVREPQIQNKSARV